MFSSFVNSLSYDDLVYSTVILFSIGFGCYYRTIKNTKIKKNVGTVVGILILLFVMRLHIIHYLVMYSLCTIVIFYMEKRLRLFLVFLICVVYQIILYSSEYLGLSAPSAPIVTTQVILAIKLSGATFDMTPTDNNTEEKIEPHWLDLFHYAFNYLGIVTGPYYRFRTLQHYFDYPFAEHANWKKAALDSIKYTPVYLFLLSWSSYIWPASYLLRDEFYERSWLYRNWYILPVSFIYRMRVYIGLSLMECICITAGLGAYPIFTNPKPGHGPTKKFQEMQKLISNEDSLSKQDYSFETIHNINPYEAEFCTSYRECIRHWSSCGHYFFGVNIYKRFPIKKYRAIATALFSAYSHGLYTGHFLSLGTLPLVLILDDMYCTLYLKNDKRQFLKMHEWVHWFFKMYFFSHQTVVFFLLKFRLILRYYNSIYHAGLVTGIVLYIVGLHLLKSKKKIEKKKIDDKFE